MSADICLLCSGLASKHSSNCPNRVTATSALIEHLEDQEAELAKSELLWLGVPVVDGAHVGRLTLRKRYSDDRGWVVLLVNTFGHELSIADGTAEEIDAKTRAWIQSIAALAPERA